MAEYTLSDRTQKLNQIQKLIKDLAYDTEEKLVRFCVQQGHSLSDIGEAIGVSKQALSKKYPDLYKYQKEKKA